MTSSADNELMEHLNAVLKNKLTGINQYFLHARLLKHQGDMQLADHEYKSSIDAMKHSDMLVEHILQAGGIPGLQELGRLRIGHARQDMLCNDLALAEEVLAGVNAAIAFCESRAYAASASLLGRIRDSQQEHIDFIRSQITPPAQPMRECA